MRHTILIIAMVSTLAAAAVFCPARLVAQTADEEAVVTYSGSTQFLRGKFEVQAMLPTGGGASVLEPETPEAGARSSTVSVQPLAAGLDWGWGNAWSAYSFSVPGQAAAAPLKDWKPRDWSNVLDGGTLAYLGKARRTAVYWAGEMQTYGRREQTTPVVDARGQFFTTRWGLTRTVAQNKDESRSLQLGINRYQQWITSEPLLIGGPAPRLSPGASLRLEGVQARLVLHRDRLLFSAEGGTQGGPQLAQQYRSVGFGVAWTW